MAVGHDRRAGLEREPADAALGLLGAGPRVRERPPSQYMTIGLPRSRIAWAETNASSSCTPRRTGKTPPGE